MVFIDYKVAITLKLRDLFSEIRIFLKKRINSPVDSPPLRDLARGKTSAVIIFDDMTRPTRTYEIAPIVVEELLAGGINEEEITFVCALGTHGALTQNEFRKKLGKR